MGTHTVDTLSYGISSLLTVIASHRVLCSKLYTDYWTWMATMFISGVIKWPKLLRFILLLYKFTSTETKGLYNYHSLNSTKMVRAPIAMYISFISQCKEKRKPPLCLFSKMGTCILWMLQVSDRWLILQRLFFSSHRARPLCNKLYQLPNLDINYAIC